MMLAAPPRAKAGAIFESSTAPMRNSKAAASLAGLFMVHHRALARRHDLPLYRELRQTIPRQTGAGNSRKRDCRGDRTMSDSSNLGIQSQAIEMSS
jgi:hypothetical protein